MDARDGRPGPIGVLVYVSSREAPIDLVSNLAPVRDCLCHLGYPNPKFQ